MVCYIRIDIILGVQPYVERYQDWTITKPNVFLTSQVVWQPPLLHFPTSFAMLGYHVCFVESSDSLSHWAEVNRSTGRTVSKSDLEAAAIVTRALFSDMGPFGSIWQGNQKRFKTCFNSEESSLLLDALRMGWKVYGKDLFGAVWLCFVVCEGNSSMNIRIFFSLYSISGFRNVFSLKQKKP